MLSNVQDELNRFAKYVISQSRANLTRGKKNSSKELYNSLKGDVKVSKNSFQLSFLMEEYGLFQDKELVVLKINITHLTSILTRCHHQANWING